MTKIKLKPNAKASGTDGSIKKTDTVFEKPTDTQSAQISPVIEPGNNVSTDANTTKEKLEQLKNEHNADLARPKRGPGRPPGSATKAKPFIESDKAKTNFQHGGELLLDMLCSTVFKNGPAPTQPEREMFGDFISDLMIYLLPNLKDQELVVKGLFVGTVVFLPRGYTELKAYQQKKQNRLNPKPDIEEHKPDGIL